MTIQDKKLPLTLIGGESAHVVLSDGDKTTISSPLPSPPGSIVRGNIQDLSCEFQLKVRNCRKEGGLFLIDGRMQNATRPMKARLQSFEA